MKLVNDTRISIKLAAAFATLVLIIAGLALVTFFEISSSRSRVEDTTQVNNMALDIEALRQQVSNQQAAVRGLLLSGNRQYIADYDTAKAEYAELLGTLQMRLTLDRAAELLSAAGGSIAAWQNDIVSRQIDLMRNPLTVDEARVLEANGYGERLLGDANAQLTELNGLAKELIGRNEAAVAGAFDLTLVVLLIGTAVALVFAAVAWLVLSRAIAMPIDAMSTFMGRMAEGECRVVKIADDLMPTDFLTKWVARDKLKRSVDFATNARARNGGD